MKNIIGITLACLAFTQSLACTTIIVGSKASQDGSVIIARNGDHDALTTSIYAVHPAQDYPKGTYLHAHVNQFSYPMPAHALKYSGIPISSTQAPSYEAAGMNSASVGLSATETIYNSPAALQIDPYVMDTGISEDILPSLLLPRIHSAKKGIIFLGKLIEKYGTREGFGVAIADVHNVWYLETASGHQWIAIRIPDDRVFVSANQSRIQTVNLQDTQNTLASPGLLAFAIKNKLYNPKQGPFNFRLAFSRITDHDINYNYHRLAALFHLYNPKTTYDVDKGEFPTLLNPTKSLSVLDVIHGLQNHYQGTPHDPYALQNPSEPWRPISVFRTEQSHIISLHANRPAPVAGIEYVSMGMGCLSLYVPFFNGIETAPAPYQVRTLTADNKSAYWSFRKMQTLAMTNYPLFAPLVQQQLGRLQKTLLSETSTFAENYTQDTQPNTVQTFVNKAVTDSINTAHALTNQMFTQMTANIQTEYLFPGG